MDRIGRVELVRSDICLVKGIQGVGLGNVVQFSSGVRGIVLGFNQSDAEIVVLDNFASIKHGDLVRVVEERMSVGVGDALLGRVINPLGSPLDGMGTIELPEKSRRPIEVSARPVYQRRIINSPLQTGYMVIDSQIPVGLGQRELLLGEKKSGQSDLAIDIICNQSRLKTGVICVYVIIDAETAGAKRRIERLRDNGGLANSIVILGRTGDAASLNYIAPMVGATIAEWFADRGKNVLIVFDNLTLHAKMYRQISLLLERPPSREAYPGDVFYLHSRLLERCGAFNDQAGGGTITALPIVETQTEDVTDFITTNLMSITDGHILFRQTLVNKGVQPAIDNGFSVSRVGGRAQVPLVRVLSEKIKSVIIRYESVSSLMSFGSDMDADTLTSYELGRRAEAVMQQDHDEYYSPFQQCALMYFVVSRIALEWGDTQMPELCKQIVDSVQKAPYDTIFNQGFLEMPYDHAEVVLKEFFDDFVKHPDTVQPNKKSERLVAEIESIDDLLNNDTEMLSHDKNS